MTMQKVARHIILAFATAAALVLLCAPVAAQAKIPKPPAAPLAYAVTSRDATITSAIDLQIAINSQQAEVTSLDDRIAIVGGVATEQSATLSAALADYDSAQKMYDERIVAMYQGGDYDMLSILLDARSFQDLVARLELVARILESDRTALEEVAVVAEQAQFQAGRLAILQAERSSLQTARDTAAAGLTSSQAQLLAMETLLPASADTLLASVRTKYAAYRNEWAACSVPLTATVKPAHVRVTSFSGKILGSPYHYSSYRATGVTFSATASWYGGDYDGHITTSGETFNSADFTCAHNSLPVGTWLIVSRADPVTKTTRRVVVVVTDRGPYSVGSDLQLSAAAATALGITSAEPAPVSLEAIRPLH